MRIAKAVSVKAARAGKTYGKKPETVLYGLALVLCVVMTFLCFAGRKTTAMASGGRRGMGTNSLMKRQLQRWLKRQRAAYDR